MIEIKKYEVVIAVVCVTIIGGTLAFGIGEFQSFTQASQQSIDIEIVTFSGTAATVYFRNVGMVSITPALLTAQGLSSNTGFTGVATNSTNLTFGSLAKGAGSSNAMTLSGLASGDVVTFKITTTVGTFAQGTYTVP